MSLKQDNQLWLRTPFVLMRTPEYLRLFDSATIGGFYRFLLTGINRQTLSQISPKYHPNSYVYKLAEMYGNENKLAAYFTDEDLHTATTYSERHIQELRKKLEDLKLIRTIKFGSGYLYIVGERLKILNIDGYTVGGEHEGYYIDKWFTMIEEDTNKFREYLLDQLGTPALVARIKKEQQVNELKKVRAKRQQDARNMKAAALGKELRAEVAVAEGDVREELDSLFIEDAVEAVQEAEPSLSGKIIRELTKYSAPETPVVEQEVLAVPHEESVDVAFAPIEEQDVEVPVTTPFGGRGANGNKTARQEPVTLQNYERRIKDAKSIRHALKIRRESLILGAARDNVNQLFVQTWMEGNLAFPEYINYSAELFHQKNTDKEPDNVRIVKQLMALREDVASVAVSSNASNEYMTHVSLTRELLREYTADQIFWTLRTLALTGIKDLQFLVENFHALKSMVGKYNAKYRAYRDSITAAQVREEARKRMEEEKAALEAEKSAKESQGLTEEQKRKVEERAAKHQRSINARRRIR